MTSGRLGLAWVFAAVAVGTLVALAVLGRGAPPVAAVDEQLVTDCKTLGAVSDPDNNSGLVNDCANLLASKPILQGDSGNFRGPLNWAANKPMAEWQSHHPEWDSSPRHGDLPAERTAGGLVPGQNPRRVGKPLRVDLTDALKALPPRIDPVADVGPLQVEHPEYQRDEHQRRHSRCCLKSFGAEDPEPLRQPTFGFPASRARKPRDSLNNSHSE